MSVPVVPVVNGMVPRESQEMTGVFLDTWVQRAFAAAGRRGALLLPYNDETGLYPVGSLVEVQDAWKDRVMLSPSFVVRSAVFVRVEGKGTAKAAGFDMENGILVAQDVEVLDLSALRSTYPLIDGSGWTALEGETEARGRDDIRVEIYGVTHAGEPVELRANLGGLVDREAAHTIEHAVIRSLRSYALATPKTVRIAMDAEAQDLKTSIDAGYRLRMPEVFGVTSTGVCGNPLTGLAHFYLASELRKNLNMGVPLPDSLQNARLSTLSKVAGDLELSTDKADRVLQGLKLGMMHNDTPLSGDRLKAILRRFPLSPWG